MAEDTDVDFGHFEEALADFAFKPDFGERMAGWVAEVLFANQGNEKVQECLAGILREEGWTCAPPCDEEPPTAERARAEHVVDTIIAASETGQFGAVGDETAQMAERLGVPRALVALAVLQTSVEQIDELVAWWPRKEPRR